MSDALEALMAAGIVQIVPVGFNEKEGAHAWDTCRAWNCELCEKEGEAYVAKQKEEAGE